MKKFLAFALTATMLTGAAQAQEAFKHLGMSVEAGTTGVGINLSYPLVTDHLVLTLGYNLPTFALTKDASLGIGGINGKIDQANSIINSYNSIVQSLNTLGLNTNNYQELEHIDRLNDLSAEVEAEINFVNYKAFLEYYPTTKSNFHFTVGVFSGNGDWINVTATANREAWAVYEQARKNNALIPNNVPNHPEIKPIEGMDEALKFNIDDQTILLKPESNGVMKAKLSVQKIKPYVGIGFGNSVPRHRVGFQMELGAYYQKAPVFESASPSTVFLDTYDSSATSVESVDDIMQTMKKISWYPQLTFRITGRLF